MKQLYKNKHWKLDEDYNIDKILYLLIDRPNIINSYNDFIWNNKKEQLNREYDLPAFLSIRYIYWYKNHKSYRENNKPAVIWYNGFKEYWKNGKRIKLK